MSALLPTDALMEQLTKRVGRWHDDLLQQHGLHLLLGDDDDVTAERLQQARRVLASRFVLGEIVRQSKEPPLLMKGLEIAELYPDVTRRPYRDVDLLINRPFPIWDHLCQQGYSPAKQSLELDHHHLPSLRDPSGTVGVELHVSPNMPRWASIPNELIFSTAEPSRTGIGGLLRPRDDLHALLIALHGWKAGFSRLRDLLDAVLLASLSEIPVDVTARQLGLLRFWNWTLRLAEFHLLADKSHRTALASRVILGPTLRATNRYRARLLAPYLVAGPVRVSAAHLSDFKHGRRARQLEFEAHP